MFVFSFFSPFETGRRTCGQVGGATEEREERGPFISPDVHTGAEMTDASLGRREGGREQKDGGNERKSKEENQENKSYARDCTEEEWDEELKSIYLLFFVVFCFPRVRFMSYSPKVFFLFFFVV